MVSTFKRPLQLAAIVAVPVLLAAKPLPDGTAYEFVVRSTSTQTGNKESIMMRGRGVMAGDNAKIEVLESGQAAENTFGSPGSYFLMTEGGSKMYLVDPSQRQYMEWNMDAMIAGLAGVMNAVGGFVKMEMSDLKITTEELGAGETVNGYPTKHVRMTQNYKVSVRVLGKTSWQKAETTTDYYFAPQLRARNPFVQNSQAWASKFDMFKNPEYKAQMAKAEEKLKGVPIKTVVKTVSTHDSGKQDISVVTSEMVKFKNMNVPKSEFEIPAGYTLVQMPTIDTRAVGSMKDSLDNRKMKDSLDNRGVGNVKDATKEVTTEAAKEAAKRKLKGIFKR